MDKITTMFQGQMTNVGRWLIVIASVALIPSIFVPTWSITLRAPQYPNGLVMEIYPHTVAGDLREVNLLNHYIGMKSMKDMEQDVAIGRSFKPMTEIEQNELREKVKDVAGDGRFELFKSSKVYDGPYHRAQHGFSTSF